MLRRLQTALKALRARTKIQPIIIPTVPSELLKGKVGLVTGGGLGIGFAIAKAMVEAGAKVYIVGRREHDAIGAHL